MAGDKKDESARSKAKRRKREKERETIEEAEATDVQSTEGSVEEPEKHAEEPEPAEAREKVPCPVVGVGASAGGLVIAQEEAQAKYDSMPRSAIDTGLVDFILPVEKMGEQLAQYIRHPSLVKAKPPDVEEKHLESLFQKIFILIRGETGHDFSHYKRNTVQRRIARRMAVHQIEDLGHYVQFLQENPGEVNILAKEMLITVTNFFRDREAFEKLQEQVIAPLVSQKAPDSFIRIWVPGCATGEEAYSIAMILYEEITRIQKHFSIQIFATDIDEESIETGRRGQYPKSIADDVSPARLKRFFIEEDNHYKIKSVIREMMVFAKHNLTKDSPFSKLDLLCCRNVLIYMDSTLQKKLIPMFHCTLNPGGILFLGESESIGTFSDLFTPIDARHKIFRRKPVHTGYEPDTEVGDYPQAEPATLFLDRTLKIRRFTPMARKMFRLIERDVGRPLADIVTNLRYEGLIEDIKAVLESLTRVEKEVQGESDRYYRMRIVPYRTAENVTDGAVITFVDITGQQEGN